MSTHTAVFPSNFAPPPSATREYERGGMAACPACAAAPSAQSIAALAAGRGANIMLSLPAAHCAACISTVESTLMAQAGVKAARLNLTQRRVLIQTEAEVQPAALIAALARAGYEAHELDAGQLSSTQSDATSRDLAMRLGVAFFAMMNVMLLSVAVWSGGEGATRDLFHWISALIAIPTVAFSGRPFFASAARALQAGRLGMDVPISLALILATSISLYETANGGHHAYFDAAVMLCFFLLLGRYLDHRTRALARSAAEELAALEVPRATVLIGAAEVIRPIAEVCVGDTLRVRPGGRMPVDGVVTAGTSEIDRSMLTGESLPAFAGIGTAVLAGELNLTGPLDIRATAIGRDSALHRMADLVAIAENAKTRYTSLAERAAAWYSPLVHILSFGAFGVWMWITGGDWRFAINISAAVLIITCPCALGLAVPAVVTSASGRLFRMGLLIKHGTALERLAEVDTIVLDKTGTLTFGTPSLTNIAAHPADVVALAAALAAASSHPLAQSLHAAALAAGIFPADVAEITEVAGYGVQGTYQGRALRLGRAEWVGAAQTPTNELTTSYFSDGGASYAFTFADRVRTGAPKAIAAFRAMSKQIYLISGDSTGPVAALAATLGIENWTAGALPQDKLALIDRLTQNGHRVLMVGDGLNDTAALARAHVSISPATALDAARVASDIVLLGADMAPIAGALRIARQARRRIIENFALSAGYNVIAVPLALVGLATPLAAALAMSLSSITVSLNALRLK
jgi:P-type Cu2+ transporter